MNADDLAAAGFLPVGVIADDEAVTLEVRGDYLPAWGGKTVSVAGPAAVHIVPEPEPAPPPVVVFLGRPKVFFLAICEECNEGRRPIPMPFGTDEDRERWCEGHRTTGHTINYALEIRQ
jgi:hypothetical protein